MRKFHTRLGDIEAVLAGTCLMLMVVLILAGGIGRLAHHPLNWTSDLATCLFAWACFLCADVAWRKDGLMSVEILTDRLPARAQRLLTVVNHWLIAAFMSLVMGSGIWLSWVSRARSFQGIPEISYSWVTASLAVGGGLLLLTTTLKIGDLARRPTDGTPC